MISLPNTLSFRLTFWYASSFVIFLLAAMIILYLSIGTVLDRRINEDIEEDLIELRDLYELGGIDRVLEEIRLEQSTEDNEDFFIRILDPDGNILHSSDPSEWNNLHVDKLALYHANSSDDETILRTIKLDDKDRILQSAYGALSSDMVLHVGESTEEKEEIMEIIFAVFSVLFLLVIPLASFIGRLISKRAVSGIKVVSEAAIDIERGKLDRKALVDNQHDEVQTLANTFNAMAERINVLITEMREMIDNIAHDLRSPLGRIRAISESTLSNPNPSAEIYKTAASDTLEECDRLIKLINTTLDVAEAEAGVSHTAKEQINLSSLVVDACELFEPAAEQKSIDLSCNLDSNCKVIGERSSLQRMLSNLLDNALKYTGPSGSVKVLLNTNSTHVDIKVSDSGIGIPASDQQRIFDRFFRCDHSRTNDGCGLGLSFARAVARAHGGDINLQSEPSKGTTFTVTLPLDYSAA